MASLVEVHNSAGGGGGPTWTLTLIGSNIVGYEDPEYPNTFPATFKMYRAYIDGTPYGLYGGDYDFVGWGDTQTKTRSLTFGPLAGLEAGTYEIELKECDCYIEDWEYPPPGVYDYSDVVIDSETSIGIESITIGPPDAPSNPTPADEAVSVSWNDTFSWTTDPENTGPFYHQYPYWTVEEDAWYWDCTNTVYFVAEDDYADLTDVRRAYNWTDSSYTLRNPNPQNFSLNDYDVVDPFPPDPVKIYWRVKTTNEWGTTWGPIWSFDVALALPEKAITPGPTHENTSVTLDQNDITWVDGGLGMSNEATAFSVYYGRESGDLTLVSSGQAAGGATNAFVIWDLLYGSPFDYAITRYWRIDSTNEAGTTTGDEWSFTTITFDPPAPSPSDPDGDFPPDYTFDPNFIRTKNRLVLAAGHQVWYEVS